MKVLWITCDTIDWFHETTCGKPTKGAPWVNSLADVFSANNAVCLAVLAPVVGGKYQKQLKNNVIGYSIGIRKGENTRWMTAKLAKKYLQVIRDFRPDVIHIHGIENNFGQIAGYLDDIPIVCSIQGLTSLCVDAMRESGRDFGYWMFRSLKNRVFRGGVDGHIRSFSKRALIEVDILQKIKNYFGRTEFDRQFVENSSPRSNYYYGRELLRRAFVDQYSGAWELKKIQKHSIFISSGAYSLKGLHILLQALRFLVRKYPEAKVIVPHKLDLNKPSLVRRLLVEDYDNYLREYIVSNNLQSNVEFKGRLTAEKMAQTFASAHVFVMPSYMENSSNALAESMIVGTPCVVSRVGGSMSIVKENETGLVFEKANVVELAEKIGMIFEDAELAQRLSKNAQMVAMARQNRMDAFVEYYTAYRSIMGGNKPKSLENE